MKTERPGDLIALTAHDMAKITGGQWEGLTADIGFPGVSLSIGQQQPGDLCVCLSRDAWRSRTLRALRDQGVAGVVVPTNAVIPNPPLPLLRVPDPTEALRQIGDENARRCPATRILVTGTEGKTGFKHLLHHIVSRQAPCHAILNSANLNIPIWRSLSSIRRNDTFAIVEVSVAMPKRGWQRSAFIKPHICVITNISPQHTIYHGGLDPLIRHKAEVVTSIEPGGVAFINADNAYAVDLQDAIQRIRRVPVMTFGSAPNCDGRLLCAEFVPEALGWQVQARIFGASVNYFISMVNSYAPLASVSALTVAAYLGLDLGRACADLGCFVPYETAGEIVTLRHEEGDFLLIDHSTRGSLAGFRSAFDDLGRILGGRPCRMVLGAVLELAEHEKDSVHRALASMVDVERTVKVYTVGQEMEIFRAAFPAPDTLGPHGTEPEDITAAVIDDIRPGEVLFIKGHHRIWLERLAAAVRERFQAVEASVPTPTTHPPPRYRLVAGGDLMVSRDVPGRLAGKDGTALFGDVQPLLSGADIVLANLECVISGTGAFFNKGERRPYYYRCPPHIVNALVEAGISAVTTANNHAMDFGPEALAEQAGLLARAGIAASGSGRSEDEAGRPAFIRVGDMIVALVSFATDQPRLAARGSSPGILDIPLNREALDRLRPTMAEARDHADLVIVSPHWGENWAEAPTEDIRRLAWSLIDLGADAILGHSAHILQGLELYRGKPIVYDMGTLLFDRVRIGRMRNTALFELGFGPDGLSHLCVHAVELEPCAARLATDQERANTFALMTRLSRDLMPGIRLEEVDGSLIVHLPPPTATPRAATPDMTTDPAARRPVAVPRGGVDEANIYQDAATALIGEPIDLGDGLTVFGARVPSEVRAGWAFAVEVLFQLTDSAGKDWRASIQGVNRETGQSFRYRHPIAEGLWVPGPAPDMRVVSDRIVVRPPRDLPPGRYDLFWNLVDRGTGRRRHLSGDHPRNQNKWLSIGTIDCSATARPGVAGIGGNADD